MQQPSRQTCLHCQHPVKGRVDKKFCNDHCRNAYHNLLNSPVNNLVRNINHCLQKNRRILADLIQSTRSQGKIPAEYLQNRGFSFQYFTHTLTDSSGHQFFFCYNYGYRRIDQDTVLVIQNEKIRGTKKIPV